MSQLFFNLLADKRIVLRVDGVQVLVNNRSEFQEEWLLLFHNAAAPPAVLSSCCDLDYRSNEQATSLASLKVSSLLFVATIHIFARPSSNARKCSLHRSRHACLSSSVALLPGQSNGSCPGSQ